jgi:hypothetical protein
MDWMSVVAKNLPDVIKASASSYLGIAALMIITFSAVVYGLFRRAKAIWRFAALFLLFVGCSFFGGVIKDRSLRFQNNAHNGPVSNAS